MLRVCIGVFLVSFGIVGGIVLAGYVGIYLMLYGGIVGAIENWGICNSAAVGNIIKAVFFGFGLLTGFVGAIPFGIGKALLKC